MLAVGRILRTGADILLLDEISEGLAPVIVQALAGMIRALRAKGYTIVMVEQTFGYFCLLYTSIPNAWIRYRLLCGLRSGLWGRFRR